MASDKKEKKLLILLEALSAGKVPLMDICTICDTNRSNSYNLINELKKRGYDVRKEVDNRNVSYYLGSEAESFEHISKSVLHKFIIMNILGQRHEYNRAELLKYIEENVNIEIKKSRLYELSNEMKREENLCIRDDRMMLTGKKYGTTLSVSTIKELYDLLYVLELNEDDSVADEVASIKEKIAFLIDNTKISIAPVIDKLKLFEESNFRKKVVKVSYNTKNSGLKEVCLGVGMIVFVENRNTASLMGYGYDLEKEEFNLNYMQIIPVDSIVNCEGTKAKNTYFMSSVFMEHYENMFAVSSEKPQDIDILFMNADEYSDKLSALVINRDNSAADYDDEKDEFRYTDCVSGMADVVKYLYDFTESAYVLRPKKLIADRAASYNKALKRYEESAKE